MPPARRKKKKSVNRGRKKTIILVSLLAVLVALTLSATFFLLFIGPTSHEKGLKRLHLQYEQSPAISEFPLPPVKPTQPPAAVLPEFEKSLPAARQKTYRMAIVIDDMGYQKALGLQFLAIDVPLSFSFLPYAPFTKLLMQEGRRRQRDMLLHVPLEPHDNSWDLGPGGLLTTMTAEEIDHIFDEDLARVPFAIGVNNHMGSKFTEDRAAMTSLLAALKKHGLFFLDSITTAKSLGFELAEQMQIPAARRNVFLDNQDDRESVLQQLSTLVRICRQHGSAIGIAHPKAGSLAAIRQFSRQLPPDIELTAVHLLLL